MFDTKDFQWIWRRVEAGQGGRGRVWFNIHILFASAVQTLLRNVWEVNNQCGRQHTTRRHHGLVNPWAGSWSVQQHTLFWWSLRDIWWSNSTPGRTIWLTAPGVPSQPQERPRAAALPRTSPGPVRSVSNVCCGKTIKRWFWELNLYAPCFLNSTDPLDIYPSPFKRLGHPVWGQSSVYENRVDINLRHCISLA